MIINDAGDSWVQTLIFIDTWGFPFSCRAVLVMSMELSIRWGAAENNINFKFVHGDK